VGQFFPHLADFKPLRKGARKNPGKHRLSGPVLEVPFFAMVVENPPKGIEAAKILGHSYIVNPSIDRDVLKQPDGWKRAAENFNRAGAELKKAGIRLGYHNHVEEFKPLPDGKLPYDVLLAESDPKLVKMEMDLGWAHEAGV